MIVAAGGVRRGGADAARHRRRPRSGARRRSRAARSRHDQRRGDHLDSDREPASTRPRCAPQGSPRASTKRSPIARWPDPTVTVVEVEGSSEAARRTAAADGRDRRRMPGVSATARPRWRSTSRSSSRQAIRDERLRRAPGALIRSGFYGAGRDGRVCDPRVADPRDDALAAAARRTLACRAARRRARPGRGDRVVGSHRRGHRSRRSGWCAWSCCLLAFDLYLTYVLGLFPWTRAVSYALLGYVVVAGAHRRPRRSSAICRTCCSSSSSR